MASKLEELGKIFRDQNMIKNTYQKDESKFYGSTHPNALSDGDSKGKGTGVFLDTYNGGTDIDINGNPIIPKSGRNGALIQNMYGPDNPYRHPDTEGNEDQFRTTDV